MKPLDVFCIAVLRFIVFSYAKAENLAPGNAIEGQSLSKKAIRIKCLADQYIFANLVQKLSNQQQQKKSVDGSPLNASSVFLNRVALNSRVYQCKNPILTPPKRGSFSWTKLARMPRSINTVLTRIHRPLRTELAIFLDCLTTSQSLSHPNGRKAVVILESTPPRMWAASKSISGADCQVLAYDDKPPNEPAAPVPPVQEIKSLIQGDGEDKKTTARRRWPRRKKVTKPPPTPDLDLEYPDSFRSPRKERKKKGHTADMAIPPVRPRVVQQSARVVQIEWKGPIKGVPIDWFRVQYMKDDYQNKWIPCHEGNLGSRVRSMRFDRCMLYRRYRFRIYAHYENGEHQYSAATTWFRLEKWE